MRQLQRTYADRGVLGLSCCACMQGEVATIGRERWAVKSGARVVAARSQVPLALGWALSVHKSQGMTLDRVTVNLAKAFEEGQAYVALRCAHVRTQLLSEMHVHGPHISRTQRASL